MEKVIKNAKTSESKVFFHKMKGDYYRYGAEVAENPKEKGRLLLLKFNVNLIHVLQVKKLLRHIRMLKLLQKKCLRLTQFD